MSLNTSALLSLQDALAPDNLTNPYPLFQRMRESNPVYWDEKYQAWIVTAYEQAIMILRDDRFSSQHSLTKDSSLSEQQFQRVAPIFSTISRQINLLDPPTHTRLRRLINKAFTPAKVETMRPFIQQLVDQILDSLQEQEHINIVNDFAFPLPTTVIAQLMGVPTKDQRQFVAWTKAFALMLDGSPRTTEEAMPLISQVEALLDYFRQLIAERRQSPQDDLIQELLMAEERGEILSEEDIIANCVLLFVAGHETTIFGISNGLFTLLQHPEQLQALQADNSFMPGAVLEMLRYESPVQILVREAKEAVTIGNSQIAAGDRIIIQIGAINRDPAHFHDPDQFNVRRFSSRDLTFGHGIHFCLGAPLARQELEIAFTTLLTRFPRIRLASSQEPCWFPAPGLRRLTELPVHLL
jgi:cytochrome P450